MNYYVLLIFAPILVLIGILGLLVPKEKAVTSGATAYNIFHIAFGLLGVAIVVAGKDDLIRAFLIGFGLIDLYQAGASYAHIFPEKHFRWTRTDDVLHIVAGLILVIVGLSG